MADTVTVTPKQRHVTPIQIRACPVCQTEWPWPHFEVKPGYEYDFTCPICLHTEIAKLERDMAYAKTVLEAYKVELAKYANQP